MVIDLLNTLVAETEVQIKEAQTDSDSAIKAVRIGRDNNEVLLSVKEWKNG